MSDNVGALAYRGETVESLHRVHLAVVDDAGEVQASFGNPDFVTFTRSSVKAYQLLPLVASGAADAFGFSDADLAVMCASHSGEPMHVERVRGILDRLGLDEGALQCGAHRPFHKPSAKALEGSPSALHNNCSGKHAGMLAAALAMKAPLDTYLEPEHPVQREVRRMLAMGAGAEPRGAGTDGCSAPNYAFSVRESARLFAHLARPERLPEPYGGALRRIRDAMRFHPHLVAGTDRHDTLVMDVEDGRLVAKVGGEAVQGCADTETGLGLFFKVEDGNPRAVAPVLIEALRQLGWVEERAMELLGEAWMPPLRNWRGTVIGNVKPTLVLEGPMFPAL